MRQVSEARIKRLIHQSNLIEGYDDPEFDAQSLVAWRYLEDVLFDQLGHSDICKVQKIITLRQTDLAPNQRGYYRGRAGNDVNVTVGGRLTPHFSMVQGLMDNWLLDYQTLDPVVAHIRFEKVHCFTDGNGRTGRLLLWWHQMKTGQELTELTAADRQRYYRWFAV